MAVFRLNRREQQVTEVSARAGNKCSQMRKWLGRRGEVVNRRIFVCNLQTSRALWSAAAERSGDAALAFGEGAPRQIMVV